MKRSLVPNDIRDFLSIAGFTSALGLFFKFFLNKDFFINGDAIFFILMGTGLLISGKVFTLPEWAKDGIQRNETLFLFSLIIGLLSLASGVLIAFGIDLPLNLASVSGIVALFICFIIGIDYWRKNKNG